MVGSVQRGGEEENLEGVGVCGVDLPGEEEDMLTPLVPKLKLFPQPKQNRGKFWSVEAGAGDAGAC